MESKQHAGRVFIASSSSRICESRGEELLIDGVESLDLRHGHFKVGMVRCTWTLNLTWLWSAPGFSEQRWPAVYSVNLRTNSSLERGFSKEEEVEAAGKGFLRWPSWRRCPAAGVTTSRSRLLSSASESADAFRPPKVL